MKRFKTQQAYFALIMLVVSVLLITGCGSDEVALLTHGVLPGTDTCTEAGPKVISSNPTNSEENVAIGTTITATFSEAMDPTRIIVTDPGHPESLAFTLYDNDHPLVRIEGTVAMSSGDTVATFTPKDPLSGGSWYTVKITKYANSASPNFIELGCSYQWEFKTEVAPD